MSRPVTRPRAVNVAFWWTTGVAVVLLVVSAVLLAAGAEDAANVVTLCFLGPTLGALVGFVLADALYLRGEWERARRPPRGPAAAWFVGGPAPPGPDLPTTATGKEVV